MIHLQRLVGLNGAFDARDQEIHLQLPKMHS